MEEIIKVGGQVKGSERMNRGTPGFNLAMVDNGLYLYCGIPNVTSQEIATFNEGKFEFNYFGGSDSGLSLILLKAGRVSGELPFNVNLYPDNRFETFKREGTQIVAQLFDSNTFEIKAIRVLPMNDKLRKSFADLWQATADNQVSQFEYDNWLFNEVYARDVEYTFKNSRQLGYVKYGYSTEKLILMAN